MDEFEFMLPNLSNNYTYRNNNTLALWDLRKHDKKLVEFQVFAEKIEDCNNNDLLSEINHNFVTCHICDINVPLLFTKQHYSSAKHKTFKNIIEICLDRLKRQIDNDVIDRNIVKVNNVHFCDKCAIAVTENEKVSHNFTEAHLNNVAKEKSLTEFEKLLLNFKEYKFDETIYVEKRERPSKFNDFVPTIDKDEGIPPPTTNENLLTNLSIKENYKTNPPTTSKNEKYAAIESNTNLSTNENDVASSTNYNEKHAIREVLETDFESLKTDNINEHEVEATKYLGKINNKWSYCKLCVANITDAAEHLNSYTHKRNIKSLKDNIMKKPRRKYCKICDITFKRKLLTVHLQSVAHLENEAKLETSESKNAHILDHFNFQDNVTLLCTFCDESIPISDSLSHIQSPKHVSIANSILDKNQIRLNPTGKYFCECCNLEVLKGFEYIHITNKLHIDKLKYVMTNKSDTSKTDVNESEGHSTTNENKNELNIEPNIKIDAFNNGEKVEDKNEEILDTVKIYPTVTLQTDLQKAWDIDPSPMPVFTESIPKEWPSLDYYCDICDIKVPNNYKNREAHRHSDKKHEKHTIVGNTDQSIQPQSPIIESNKDKMNYLFDKAKNERMVTCRVCYTLVARKVSHHHVYGKKHCQNYKKLLAVHQIIVVLKNMYCQLCNIQICERQELIHIKSAEHRKKLKPKNIKIKEISLYYCSICDVEILNSQKTIEHHLNYSTHKRNERRLGIISGRNE